MNEKTAIVLSGGGMKCAYTSGALLALQRHYKFTSPDIMIAASGSVPAMFYYIGEQYRDIEKLWTSILTDNHKAVSLTHLPIIDLDYLVDKLSKKELPINIEAIKNSNIDYYIPMRNADTGDLIYLDRNNPYDIYEVSKAAMAIPMAYGKEVRLGDNNYIDGFYGATIESYIERAIEAGATKIISINCYPIPSELGKLVDKIGFNHKFGTTDDKHFYDSSKEYNGVELVRIRPTRDLPTGMIEVDKDDMIDSFFMGYQNMSNNKKIFDLIGNKKRWLI